MSEVIHVFENPIYLNGVPYTAQVVGREAGHIWEGWIEFATENRDDVRRTRRETTQPNRAALEYWATGLSGTYLEGALARTLDPAPPAHEVLPSPFFESPAPNRVVDLMAVDRAVLDPFSVAAKGGNLLRQELGALRGWHLRNIIRAYNLADDGPELETLSEPELVEIIVAGVQPV